MWTDSVHISLTQLLDGQNYMALLGLRNQRSPKESQGNQKNAHNWQKTQKLLKGP